MHRQAVIGLIGGMSRESSAEYYRIIYRGVVAGRVLTDSRADYREVMARLARRGAEAIILGCTEIMLLVGAEDSAVPLFDTTTIHAIAAVDRALAMPVPA